MFLVSLALLFFVGKAYFFFDWGKNYGDVAFDGLRRRETLQSNAFFSNTFHSILDKANNNGIILSFLY